MVRNRAMIDVRRLDLQIQKGSRTVAFHPQAEGAVAAHAEIRMRIVESDGRPCAFRRVPFAFRDDAEVLLREFDVILFHKKLLRNAVGR